MPMTWLASHQEGPHSITDQSMWDLWWTEGHWDRFIHIFNLHLILPLRGQAWESLNKAVLYFNNKEVYDRKVLGHCSVLQRIIWCLGCDPCTCFPCCWQLFTVVSNTGYKLTHRSNYTEGSPFWGVCYNSSIWIPFIVWSLKFSWPYSQDPTTNLCHESEECPFLPSFFNISLPTVPRYSKWYLSPVVGKN
jgi:hypothetical protein